MYVAIFLILSARWPVGFHYKVPVTQIVDGIFVVSRYKSLLAVDDLRRHDARGIVYGMSIFIFVSNSISRSVATFFVSIEHI